MESGIFGFRKDISAQFSKNGGKGWRHGPLAPTFLFRWKLCADWKTYLTTKNNVFLSFFILF